VKTLKEEIVTMDILRRQGETNQAIAARLGITEGAVRYHLKRLAQETKDGRSKRKRTRPKSTIFRGAGSPPCRAD
jgi:predicted ArsR family transcriptional regulator